MKVQSSKIIRGLRISIPYVLAVVAPVVMAGKFSDAYSAIWETIPAVTAAMIKYGLFLRDHLWLAVVLALVPVGIFQVIANHPKFAETAKTAYPAIHLTGVLIAILIIFSFWLPRAFSSVG